MKEDRGRDGGEGEMKGGRGWREGLNEHASYRTVRVCFLRFPLIELVLLNVQYSAFRLMVELIFLTLLCSLCVYVSVCVCVYMYICVHLLSRVCVCVCVRARVCVLVLNCYCRFGSARCGILLPLFSLCLSGVQCVSWEEE